jgi:hypothetical protein
LSRKRVVRRVRDDRSEVRGGRSEERGVEIAVGFFNVAVRQERDLVSGEGADQTSSTTHANWEERIRFVTSREGDEKIGIELLNIMFAVKFS